jgi:hypothetical protein
MIEREPNLVHSSLSGPVSKEGVTVEAFICRLEHQRGGRLKSSMQRGL